MARQSLLAVLIIWILRRRRIATTRNWQPHGMLARLRRHSYSLSDTDITFSKELLLERV